MKAAIFIAFAYSAGTVSAYGLKGAVERAMWFADYLAEEIYDEDDHTFKTAPGCTGTRKGLRRQENRCTLAEFLDHVWHSTQLPVQDNVGPNGQLQEIGRKLDERPDKAEMENKISPKAKNVFDTDLNKLSQAIMSLTTKPINGPLDVAKPPNGYTGNLDMSKVYNSYSPDQFYRGLRDSGAYRKQTAEEIEKRIEADEKKDPKDQKMTKSQKRQLRRWAGEAKFGAEYDYELRVRDAREFELNPQKNGPSNAHSLEHYFGHEVKTKNHEYPSERLKKAAKLGNYKEADRDATAERWKDAFDGDVDKAKAAFDQAREDFMNQDVEHKSALNSAEDNVHGTACPI